MPFRLLRHLGRRLSRRRAVPERRSFAALRAMAPAQREAALADARGEGAGWIEAAALHGLVEAQVLLGQMHLDGTGVPRDPARAFRWFLSAAEAGHPPGLNMAGRCHESGWGTAPDPARAAALYRSAAEKGLDWAQYNLAGLLLRGAGVPRDRAQALHWYRQAAGQGHAKAMNMLGRFHENGWEVPRDPAEAARCYRAAAEGGDFRGQFNLGSLLAQHGRKPEALRWLRAAVLRGSADFLEEAGRALMGSRDPDYRALAALALARAQGLPAC